MLDWSELLHFMGLNSNSDRFLYKLCTHPLQINLSHSEKRSVIDGSLLSVYYKCKRPVIGTLSFKSLFPVRHSRASDILGRQAFLVILPARTLDS
jgi:hypothetical protein